MDFICTLVILSLASCAAGDLISDNVPRVVFNVMDSGAVGDGTTDDTQAFARAWNSTCGATTAVSKMVIPPNKAFLVKPIIFQGPCKATNVSFQVLGAMVAPDTPSAWNGIDSTRWLMFQSVNNLTIDGNGLINGRGANWWKQACRDYPKPGCTTLAPTALGFYGCNDLLVSFLKVRDSPQMQVVVFNCQRVWISDLNIMAPETSPNTDGIHIQSSQHVTIEHSSIGTGDDCISIGDGTYDVNINRIVCGPGHGISVGSLGRDNTEASVQDVHVRFASFYKTTNGARIKTWQGGRGFVRGISFEHLTFSNVNNPVIIDQYYCDAPHSCPPQRDAVQISNVTYAHLEGTSKTLDAISLNCSQSINCSGIRLENVNITSADPGQAATAVCINTHVENKGYIYPTVTCLNV